MTMNDFRGEQLEEGEIVDDDFEDISDNSIIEPTFGKFVQSNERLRALSLSSDSETDVINLFKHKRKLLRTLKIKHQRRRKKRRIQSESSDSDVTPPPDLKDKLKEAIHISGIEEIHKNPLEIRLKAMGGLVVANVPAETPPAEPLPDQATGSDVVEKIDDNELENLRIEALKTAVLNKFQRRKRKKALLESQAQAAPLEKQENKENNTPKDEPKNGDNVQAKSAVIDLEDDEDLLRASLLAGLAKKITKTKTITENVVKTMPNLPVHVVPTRPKPPIKNLKATITTKPKTQVKPLIIHVNDDSDSDDEVKPDLPKTTPIPKADIATNVDKFLKEQRQQFEIKSKLAVAAKKRFQLNNKNKILEKSAVKLLPKSQQIEYQQLLKKLRSAERQKRVAKIAIQKTKRDQLAIAVQPEGSVQIAPSSSKVEIVVQPVQKTIESKASIESTKSDGSSSSLAEEPKENEAEKKARLTNELSTLQRTLKELKTQRNGSLQIKSKYQVLTPIIRKITTTSSERKKHEQRIKTLLQELKEARKSLAKSHEIFSALVRELVSKKECVDKAFKETRINQMKKANGNLVANVQKINNVKKEEEEEERVVPVTSTPIKSQIVVDELTVSTLAANSTNNDCEDMDVCNSDETDIYQIDIVDPNDIDQIFKRKPPAKSTIPEYVSPLNFNSNERYRNVDPHAIMCPYELNGSCRDGDCGYKHYLKNKGGFK